MISLKLVVRSLKGRCHGNQILLFLVPLCLWIQAAGGAAGRANIGFALYPIMKSSVAIG